MKSVSAVNEKPGDRSDGGASAVKQRAKPLVVGVTGGVGAGKSRCLSYMEAHCSCLVVHADDVAGDLRKRGETCFEPLVALLGPEVLGRGGEISAKKMAARIFADPELLAGVNAILHPEVRKRITGIIDEERAKKRLDFLFIEAALLIETGYEEIVDEMWYIYAEENIRRGRLKANRGYSDARIDGILAKQLGDADFRAHCRVVIDNSGDFSDTARQIDDLLG